MHSSLPIVAVNGVVDAQLSPLDRGFAYGDGVFETCKLQNAKIPLWHLHCERLLKSCEVLLIPVSIELIEAQLKNLLATISLLDSESAVVKITVTRGQGGRGYRLPEVSLPTVVIGIFPAPNYPLHYFSQGITARLCQHKLSCNSDLAGLKHLNRLEQVLARSEWNDDSIAEGIVFDTKNRLVEAVFSNIFLIKNNEICTPDLSESGVAGVMRRFIIETIAPNAGLNIQIKAIYLDDLLSADAVFLCNSLYGIWSVNTLIAEQNYLFQVHPISQQLQYLLNNALLNEALVS